MMQHKVLLNGDLSLGDLVAIARGENSHPGLFYPEVSLAPEAEVTLREFRLGLEAAIERGDIIYGVNTGCGAKKGTIIPNDEIDNYQAHYIPAHSVGFGDHFPEEIVRAAMILRVNSFALGHSGVRLEVCQQILDMYNEGVIPFIPSKGSVGASGDLCPLAHLAAAMTGVKGQKAYYRGKLLEATEALKLADLKPIKLKAKEAMGITNGSTFTLAIGLLALHDYENLLEFSHFAAALSLEAIRGEKAAFDRRVHQARKNEDSLYVALRILELTSGSRRMTDESRAVCLEAEKKYKKYQDDEHTKVTPRVQDAYSFRGYPQVAGPALTNLRYAREVLLNEMNAATDNPLIFRVKGEEGKFEAISGGNFHGEPLAHAVEILKLGAQSLAGISDRRFYAMLSAHSSYGLPDDLAGPKNKDLNTGFMILQYTTAALVSENKVLCHPAVSDSIPTSAGQEDYVSMGIIGARHLREIISNTYGVIAAELLAAAQGISLTEDELEPSGSNQLGVGTSAIYTNIRWLIPPMLEDRYIQADFQKILDYILTHKPADLLSLDSE